MRENYHTHTWRCKHATGEALDYARVAHAAGCQVLGFTDHTPQPDGRWESVRMRFDQLPGYIAAVQEADRAYDDMRVLLGMECEYDRALHAFYTDELLGRCGLRYLAASVHYVPIEGAWESAFGSLNNPRHLRAYADHCRLTLESGLFAFLAHPDLMGCTPQRWTADCAAAARDICAVAVACAVPLEINTYGLRKPLVKAPDGKRPPYPWPPFWEIAAEAGVTVVVNSDAHRPQDVCAGEERVAPMLRQLGLRRADMRGRLGLIPV